MAGIECCAAAARRIKLWVLTFSGGGRFQSPELLLLQTGAVRVQLEAERLGRHVFVLPVDQSDGPPALLLVL